jgi:hypothetical protein
MSKIQPTHLTRAAYVYIRQSTMTQVHQNVESQRRQYALVERAKQLGWDTVQVIDTDLGRSGSGHVQRDGFDDLVAVAPAIPAERPRLTTVTTRTPGARCRPRRLTRQPARECRMLGVAYSGNGGRVPRYACHGGRVNRGAAACLSVGSLRVDHAKDRLLALGGDLRQLGQHAAASVVLKKRILRTVLEEIAVNNTDDPPQHVLHLHRPDGELLLLEQGRVIPPERIAPDAIESARMVSALAGAERMDVGADGARRVIAPDHLLT